MKKDVLIGFPCYDGRAEVSVMQEIIHAIQDPNCPVGAVQYYNGDSLIPRGRNKIAKMFLDSKFDYLMFIDSDIVFHRDMITKLRSHNKGIAGGMYLKKTLPYTPVMNGFLGDEDGLTKMRELGTGFLMIRRDVFAAIQAMHPEDNYQPDNDEPKGDYHDWFKVGVKNGRYLSEDYYFCQNALELGYASYLDRSILVKHLGRMEYPTQDEALIKGASYLLDNWTETAPLPPAFDDLSKAVAKHEANKNKPVKIPHPKEK